MYQDIDWDMYSSLPLFMMEYKNNYVGCNTSYELEISVGDTEFSVHTKKMIQNIPTRMHVLNSDKRK